MEPCESRGEAWPPASGEPPVQLPFREFRETREGLLHRLQKNLSRQSCRQWIDGLESRQVGARIGRHDIVWMRHLQPVAIELDAARHIADAANRELALDEPAVSVK